MVHEVRAWPVEYEALLAGAQTARAFSSAAGVAAGHVLVFREWAPPVLMGQHGRYSGRELRRVVTHVGHGAARGLVVLSLADPDAPLLWPDLRARVASAARFFSPASMHRRTLEALLALFDGRERLARSLLPKPPAASEIVRRVLDEDDGLGWRVRDLVVGSAAAAALDADARARVAARAVLALRAAAREEGPCA